MMNSKIKNATVTSTNVAVPLKTKVQLLCEIMYELLVVKNDDIS